MEERVGGVAEQVADRRGDDDILGDGVYCDICE